MDFLHFGKGGSAGGGLSCRALKIGDHESHLARIAQVVYGALAAVAHVRHQPVHETLQLLCPVARLPPLQPAGLRPASVTDRPSALTVSPDSIARTSRPSSQCAILDNMHA